MNLGDLSQVFITQIESGGVLMSGVEANVTHSNVAAARRMWQDPSDVGAHKFRCANAVTTNTRQCYPGSLRALSDVGLPAFSRSNALQGGEVAVRPYTSIMLRWHAAAALYAIYEKAKTIFK